MKKSYYVKWYNKAQENFKEWLGWCSSEALSEFQYDYIYATAKRLGLIKYCIKNKYLKATSYQAKPTVEPVVEPTVEPVVETSAKEVKKENKFIAFFCQLFNSLFRKRATK